MPESCFADQRVSTDVFRQMPQALVNLEGEELESAAAGVLFGILDACACLSDRLSLLQILRTFWHTDGAQSHGGDIASAVHSQPTPPVECLSKPGDTSASVRTPSPPQVAEDQPENNGP